jgi:hypothetical protein
VLMNPVLRIDLSVGGSAWEESRLEEFHYISEGSVNPGCISNSSDANRKTEYNAAFWEVVIITATLPISVTPLRIGLLRKAPRLLPDLLSN